MAFRDRFELPVVQGWTADLDFDLTVDGDIADLTGATVVPEMKDKAGVAITLSGTVSIPSPTAGLIRFSPASGDFDAADSPASLRFKVTKNGRVTYFPNDNPIRVFIGV